MDELKLIALDAEDLAVISAHMQDAVLKVGDMAYLPRERRFAAICNRFDWSKAAPEQAARSDGRDLIRRRTALRFERVLEAKIQGIDLKRKGDVLSLLAVQFTPSADPEDPEGHVDLIFAGGGAIRLHVECVEAELKDLGPAWLAKTQPRHPDKD